jgi:hypothetical protein
MANRHVEVTRRNWGQRIMGSLKGILFGLLLFFGAFIVLWRTEGRTDMSRIAEQSTPISAATVNSGTDGQLVAASGRLTINEPVGDPDFLMAGNYVQLERQVEMYAWVERSRSQTEQELGGGETTTTEYYYEQTWTSSPPNSSNFRQPGGHENPALTVSRQSFVASNARVGAYAIDANGIGLPTARDVRLAESMLRSGEHRLQSDYVYMGTGSLQQPTVGDVRIKYRAVPADIEVTVFAQQQGDRLVPYVDRDGNRLYTAHEGTRESGIAAMASAYRTAGWLGRGAGFLMMWIGLSLILGPISVFFSVIPFLGNLSGTMIRIFTFGVALVVAAITSIVAAILQSFVGLLCVGVLVLAAIGGGTWFLANRNKEKAPAGAAT